MNRRELATYISTRWLRYDKIVTRYIPFLRCTQKSSAFTCRVFIYAIRGCKWSGLRGSFFFGIYPRRST